MLNIKHTICPSCSVGCGINLVSNDETILGTFPYKRHPINEGKNCLNGRYCFKDFVDNQIKHPSEVKNKKLVDSDLDTIIDLLSEKIKESNPEEFGILCSGNSTNEELAFIKKFTDEYKNNLILYENNFIKIDENIASYDDVNNAKNILIIGDIFNENPLIGRRVILAQKNGAQLYSADTKEESITSINFDRYIKIDSVSEFLDNIDDEIKNNLNENSVIIFNKVDNTEDCNKIIELANTTKSKILPVLKNCNSRGALNIITPSSKEEILEFLDNINVLIVINENPLEYLDEADLKKVNTIVSISNYENDMTRISDFVIPGKPWALKEGSFTNSGGVSQEFSQAIFVDNDNLSEIEVLKKLSEKLGIDL